VTHPFHPLFQREFELCDYRRSWGKDCLDFQDDQGVLRTIPIRFTDAAEADPFVCVADERAFFRIEDLVELAALIAKLRS